MIHFAPSWLIQLRSFIIIVHQCKSTANRYFGQDLSGQSEIIMIFRAGHFFISYSWMALSCSGKQQTRLG